MLILFTRWTKVSGWTFCSFIHQLNQSQQVKVFKKNPDCSTATGTFLHSCKNMYLKKNFFTRNGFVSEQLTASQLLTFKLRWWPLIIKNQIFSFLKLPALPIPGEGRTVCWKETQGFKSFLFVFIHYFTVHYLVASGHAIKLHGAT